MERASAMSSVVAVPSKSQTTAQESLFMDLRRTSRLLALHHVSRDRHGAIACASSRNRNGSGAEHEVPVEGVVPQEPDHQRGADDARDLRGAEVLDQQIRHEE